MIATLSISLPTAGAGGSLSFATMNANASST